MSKLLIGFALSMSIAFTAGTASAEQLSLARCLELARQQNLALQAAKKNPPLASEQVQESKSAYLPRVDLDAGYTVRDNPRKVETGNTWVATEDRDYAYMSLGAEQLLYDFGRSAARVGRAQATADVASSELVSREQDLFLSTTRTYYQVLAGQQLLQSARDEVDQVTEHRRVAAALYQQGVVTRNDLLQAEVRLAASRQQQLVRQGELDNSWLALNYLTGRPAPSRAELMEPDIPGEPVTVDAQQLDERPELVAQQHRVAAADASVEEHRSSYFPELYARLGADYVQNSHIKDQTVYSATLGLRVNLFDGQAKAARLRQSLLARDREKLLLDDIRAQTELAFNQASNDVGVARTRIAVAETAIRQAEENLRINRERYLNQVGTATEVLDAQTLLTRTHTDLALAQFDYHVAVARLRRIVGDL